ncbi:hypothetical protein [Sphingomonas sp.]|uniref:hypothetical protein n=1 Tax=Sphingomonas sp. TaxID=28214 RepID=UPI003AFF9492
MGDKIAGDGGANVASSRIVDALAGLPKPPTEPTLLAELLQRRAGLYINIQFARYDDLKREARVDTRNKLTKMIKLANGLLRHQSSHTNYSLLHNAVGDVLQRGTSEATYRRTIASVVRTIEAVANIEMRRDDSDFAVKPKGDEGTRAIVRACGQYFRSLGLAYTGAPRRKQGEHGPEWPIVSEAAKLTFAVLDALEFSVTGRELGTHMNAVRKEMRK